VVVAAADTAAQADLADLAAVAQADLERQAVMALQIQVAVAVVLAEQSDHVREEMVDQAWSSCAIQIPTLFLIPVAA
jgi:hypothetical protein